MPTIIHCHTGRRLQAIAAGWAIAIMTLALTSCGVADFDSVSLASEARPAPAKRAGDVDPDYLPSQFPAPSGEVQPLPPQF